MANYVLLLIYTTMGCIEQIEQSQPFVRTIEQMVGSLILGAIFSEFHEILKNEHELSDSCAKF